MQITINVAEGETEFLWATALLAGRDDLADRIRNSQRRAESFKEDEPVKNTCRHNFDCFGGYWLKCTECDTVKPNE